MKTLLLLVSGRGTGRPFSHYPPTFVPPGIKGWDTSCGPGMGRGASMTGVSFGHDHAVEECQCHIPSPPASHFFPAGWDTRVCPRRAPGCGSAFDLQQLLSRKLSVLCMMGKKELGLYKGFCCFSTPSQHRRQEAGTSQCHLPHICLPKDLPSPAWGDAPIPGVG